MFAKEKKFPKGGRSLLAANAQATHCSASLIVTYCWKTAYAVRGNRSEGLDGTQDKMTFLPKARHPRVSFPNARFQRLGMGVQNSVFASSDAVLLRVLRENGIPSV
jgi:hypothetical protein